MLTIPKVGEACKSGLSLPFVFLLVNILCFLGRRAELFGLPPVIKRKLYSCYFHDGRIGDKAANFGYQPRLWRFEAGQWQVGCGASPFPSIYRMTV